MLRTIALLILLPAVASAGPGTRQDASLLAAIAEQFLLAQAANLPGTPSVKVNLPDSRLQLAHCDAPQAYLPNGSRAIGKTSVGIRCHAPVVWNVFLPATVSVITSYVATAAPLSQGQRVGSADVVIRQGDLASLPSGVLTDVSQANGRTLQMPVAAGMPVSRSMLKSQPVVRQGQPVRLVAQGSGFSVTGEANALTSGSEGELVQARTAGGQVIGGIAQADGSLSVRY